MTWELWEQRDRCWLNICRGCRVKEVERSVYLLGSNSSLKTNQFWDKSPRQGRNWVGPLRQELTFGRASVGSGKGSWPAEWRIAEWFWELRSHKFVVAPVHVIAVFPPAELSSPIMKSQKLLVETESEDAVNLRWYRTAIKFHEFKFVDERIDSVILWILKLANAKSQVLNRHNLLPT